MLLLLEITYSEDKSENLSNLIINHSWLIYWGQLQYIKYSQIWFFDSCNTKCNGLILNNLPEFPVIRFQYSSFHISGNSTIKFIMFYRINSKDKISLCFRRVMISHKCKSPLISERASCGPVQTIACNVCILTCRPAADNVRNGLLLFPLFGSF